MKFKKLRNITDNLVPAYIRYLLFLGYSYNLLLGIYCLFFENNFNTELSLNLGIIYIIELICAFNGFETMESWKPKHVIQHHLPACIAFPCIDTFGNQKMRALFLLSSINELLGVILTFNKNKNLNKLRHYIGALFFIFVTPNISYQGGIIFMNITLIGKIVDTSLYLFMIYIHSNYLNLKLKKIFNISLNFYIYWLINIILFIIGIFNGSIIENDEFKN